VEKTLETSKQILENFNVIEQNISHHLLRTVTEGWSQLRQMLTAVEKSTLKHQLNENRPFLRSMFIKLLDDQVSQLIMNALLINAQDENLMVDCKINALECLGLMTYGLTLFDHKHYDQDQVLPSNLYDSMHISN